MRKYELGTAAAMAVLIGGGLTTGCRSDKGMDRPSQRSSVRSEAADADALILAVQSARTPQAEADALRRLREHMTDNGLTYDARTFRQLDNTPVEVASVQGQQVRAQVTLYRGRDVVRTFVFVPKDNRNLTLLGE